MKRLLSTLALAAVAVSAADYPAEAKRWWSHIEFLASDALEGRDTGSPGHKKAAEYVAQEFERSGLKAAGKQGYIQPVPFHVKRIDESKSKLEIIRGGQTQNVTLGDTATFNLRFVGAGKAEGDVIFVGHGLVIPEAKVNDLADVDLRGRIAMYITGGPSTIPGALKSHYSTRGERWKALEKAGAIGMVEIPNPKSMDIPWERSKLARFMPVMSPADPKMEETAGVQFAVTLNPARADEFLQSAPYKIKDLLALADADKPLPHFAIGARLRSVVATTNSEVESQNIAGILPGSDPKLKNEYVVMTAHIDHIGKGEPVNGDSTYNGAMDNASGIASLIEISRMMREAGLKPRRSILFIAVTGEEKGLQGSRWAVEHPLVPRDKMVADINMDMFLPLFPLKTIEVQGLVESTLGDDVKAAAEKYGVGVQADQNPNRNAFIRSDQYSFISKGIPALAFKFGFSKGSPEAQIQADWLKNRYHAPSDDLNQPVAKEDAAKFNRILIELSMRVANADKKPEWKPESFFRRFAAK